MSDSWVPTVGSAWWTRRCVGRGSGTKDSTGWMVWPWRRQLGSWQAPFSPRSASGCWWCNAGLGRARLGGFWQTWLWQVGLGPPLEPPVSRWVSWRGSFLLCWCWEVPGRCGVYGNGWAWLEAGNKPNWTSQVNRGLGSEQTPGRAKEVTREDLEPSYRWS